MRVLITNDDGIDAEGLGILESIANAIFEDVWVIAPSAECSGFSHSVTATVPIRIKQLAEKRFVVDGSPADCVIMALSEVMRSEKPELILSGVNCGENAGGYVTYSGTVGAAMEAALSGISAIAFSQAYKKNGTISWEAAEESGLDLVKKLSVIAQSTKIFLNVNFPAQASIKGIRAVRQGRHLAHCEVKVREDCKGKKYYWLDAAHYNAIQDSARDTDLSCLSQNFVTVTPLKFDFTDYDALADLKRSLDS